MLPAIRINQVGQLVKRAAVARRVFEHPPQLRPHPLQALFVSLAVDAGPGRHFDPAIGQETPVVERGVCRRSDAKLIEDPLAGQGLGIDIHPRRAGRIGDLLVSGHHQLLPRGRGHGFRLAEELGKKVALQLHEAEFVKAVWFYRPRVLAVAAEVLGHDRFVETVAPRSLVAAAGVPPRPGRVGTVGKENAVDVVGDQFLDLVDPVPADLRIGIAGHARNAFGAVLAHPGILGMALEKLGGRCIVETVVERHPGIDLHAVPKENQLVRAFPLEDADAVLTADPPPMLLWPARKTRPRARNGNGTNESPSSRRRRNN